MKQKNIKILMFLSVIILLFMGISAISASDVSYISESDTNLELQDAPTPTDYSTVETPKNYIKNNENKSLKTKIDKINTQQTNKTSTQDTTDNPEISKNNKNLKSEDITIGNDDFYKVQADYTISNNGGKTVTLQGNVNYNGYDRSLKYTLTSSSSTLNIDGSSNTVELTQSDTLTINSEGKYFFWDLGNFQMAMILNSDHSKKLSDVYTNIDLPVTFTVPTTGTYKFYFAGSFSYTTLENLGPEIWFGTSYKEIIESPEEPDTPTPTEVTLSANDATIKNGETGTITINTNPNINQGTVTVTDANGNTIATADLANSNTFNYQANGMPGTQITLTYNYADTTSTYTASSTTSKVTITKRNSITSSQPVSTNVGNVKVKVTVVDEDGTTPITNGTINILNGNTIIATASLSGSNTVEIPLDLAAGNYNLVANYTGNNYHTTSKDENGLKDLTINSNAITISAPNKESKYGTTTNIEITTTPNINQGTVTITDNNGFTQNIDLAQSNSFNYPVNGEPGNEITLTYTYQDPTGTYTSEETTSKVTITKRDSITSSQPVSTNVGNVKVKVTVVDEDGSTPITNGTVNILNGNSIIGTTSLSGSNTVEIPLDLAAGNYNLVANYTGNNYHTTSKDENGLKDLTINSNAITISAPNKESKYGTTTNIEITTTPNINQGTVTITDNNGFTQNIDLAQSNSFNYPVNGEPGNEITLTYTYQDSTGTYTSEETTSKVTITKRDSITSSQPTSTNAGNVKVSVTVVDEDGTTPITNGTINILNGNDIIATATLEGSNSIEIPLDLAAGNYNLVANYTGNNYHTTSKDENGLKDLTIDQTYFKPIVTVITEGKYAGEFINVNGTISIDEDIDLEGSIVNITLKTNNDTINDFAIVQHNIEENYYYYVLNDIHIDYETPVSVSVKFIKDANIESYEENPEPYWMEYEELESLTDSDEVTTSFDVVKVHLALNVNDIDTLVGKSARADIDLKVDTPNLNINFYGRHPYHGEITLIDSNNNPISFDAEHFDYVYFPDVSTNGTFTYTVKYHDESNMYEDAETTFNVIVKNIGTTLTLKAEDIYVDQEVNISGKLTSSDDTISVKDKQINLTIDSIGYVAFTDENGDFKFDQIRIHKVSENIPVTAIFGADKVLATSNEATDTFNVLILPVEISSDETVTTSINKPVSVSINLKDTINNNQPTTGTITITKDDEVVSTIYLDSEFGDELIFNPDVSTNGSFVYKLEYVDENGKYSSCDTSVNVIVNTIASTITVQANDVYVDENVKISGTLKAEDMDVESKIITLTINGNTYTAVTDEEGNFEFNEISFDKKEDNVEVKAIFNKADGIDTSNEATATFNVKLLPVNVTANNITTKAKEDVKIPISLTDLINEVVPTQGTVVVKLNDETVATLSATDNPLEFTADTSVVGEYEYTITFTDGIRYDTNTTTVKVIVESIPTEITLNAENIDAGENVSITGKLTANNEPLANQEVTITFKENQYIVKTDKNGEFKLNNVTINIAEENIEVTAVFNENLPYAQSNTETTTFNVNKVDVELTSEDKTTKVNSDIDVVFTATDKNTNKIPTQGIVTVTDEKGNIIKTFDVSKDELKFTHQANEDGIFKYTLTFTDEENKYNTYQTTATVTVNKLATKTTAENKTAIFGEEVTIEIEVTDEDGLTPTVGTVEVLDENNQIIKTFDISKDKLEFTHKANAPGEFIYTIKYQADKNYLPSQTTQKVTVSNKDVTLRFIEVSDTTVGKNNNIQVELSVGNEKISGEYVTINVDGKNYTVKTDSEGIATLNTFKSKVERKGVKVIASYPGNDTTGYNKADTIEDSFDVNKINTTITIDPIDEITFADNVTITGTLTSVDGDKLSKYSVTLTLNNINYTVKTDKNGKYSFNIRTDLYDKNNVSISYAGNSKYNPSSNKAEFKVNKVNTTLTINPIESGKYGDEITITGKLTDINNNPLNNGNIQVSINNVNYTTRTNNNGEYTVTIKADSLNTNNVTAKFNGDDKYNSADANTTFEVAEIPTELTINVSNSNVNSPATINVTLTDDNKKPITDKVNITINGKTKEYTINNGSLSIEYVSTSATAVNVTVSYDGNTQKGYASAIDKSAIINVDKRSTKVTVDSVKTIVGDKFTLTAHVVDNEGNPVNGGNLIFKVNGLTLREDGKFGSNAKPLILKVSNGITQCNITAELYLKNAKKINATYSGNSQYYANRTETPGEIEVLLRNAEVNVKVTPSKAKQNQTITITTTLKDVTPNSNTKKFVDSDNDYVFLKLNGLTIKDDSGNPIKLNVTNGVAEYNYTIPRAMTGVINNTDKNHTITAVFSSKNYYPSNRNNTTFNVERSPINITLNQASFASHKLNIKGSITDEFGLNVLGSNRVCVKINGVTYAVNNQTQYYTVNNGTIDLSLNLISSIKNVRNVQIVSGDRQAYLGNRSNVLELQ